MKRFAFLIPAAFSLAGLWSPPAQAFKIVHSNDVMGDIEPCGCRGLPKGGMLRKETLLKGLQDPELLQLDAGDLLFSSESVPELLSAESEIQAKYLLKAMELLHHDAVVPGEKDFALGLSTFEKLIKNTNIAFIAANLSRKDGKTFLRGFTKVVRKQANGREIRIVILGLVGENLRWPEQLKTEPVIQTAKRLAQELRSEADLLIALTHQGHEADRKLAEAVPELDLIIGGHTQAFLQQPVNYGSAAILETSYRNQFIGVLTPEFEKAKLKKPISAANYQAFALDEFYEPIASAGKTPVQQLLTEFRNSLAEARKTREAELTKIAQTETPAAAVFQTTRKCAECHPAQFRFWKKSPHFGARKSTECEQCHGAGGNHPFSGVYQKTVADKICLGCHTKISGAQRARVSCKPAGAPL